MVVDTSWAAMARVTLEGRLQAHLDDRLEVGMTSMARREVEGARRLVAEEDIAEVASVVDRAMVVVATMARRRLATDQDVT